MSRVFWIALCGFGVVPWALGCGPDGDTTPPTVRGVSPDDGATEVARDAVIGAEFSEDVDPATVHAGSFFVSGAPGDVEASGASAFFRPTPDLAAQTTFTATLTMDVTDLAGNPLESEVTWSFTTSAQTCGPNLEGCPDESFCLYEEEQSCGENDEIGVCNAPPTECSPDYAPVCGCDGRTYINACVSYAHGVSTRQMGPCGQVPGLCGGVDCSDGNECTFDTCADGKCRNSPAANGTPCSAGEGECETGVCQPGAGGASPTSQFGGARSTRILMVEE